MSFGLYFRPTGFSPDAYDEATKQLEQAGLGFGSVPGRTFHCAMELDGSVAVFDIWESMEQFDKFGQVLIPIMEKVGADPGRPSVMTIHNMQHG